MSERVNAKGVNAGNAARAAERRVEAMRMRRDGASYRDIAASLGVSVATAHKDVRRVLASLGDEAREAAGEHVLLESMRLDAALRGCGGYWMTTTPRRS